MANVEWRAMSFQGTMLEEFINSERHNGNDVFLKEERVSRKGNRKLTYEVRRYFRHPVFNDCDIDSDSYTFVVSPSGVILDELS